MTDRFDTRPNIQTVVTGGTTLQRYRTCNYSEFDTATGGEWVKAEEALAEIDRLKKEIEAAKIALVMNMMNQPVKVRE